MKKRIGYLIIIFLLTGALVLQAQPVLADESTDEADSIFSGGDTVVSQDTVVKDTVDEELKEKHIGFSGEIDTSTTYTDNSFNGSVNDWTGTDQIELLNQVDADLFLDVRLKRGIKGFLSTGVSYVPALTEAQQSQLGLKNNTAMTVNEFFVDTNLNNKVYFRTGKQVLQWGTGYLWNPTDLINIDRKDFFDMSKIREGTFGEKIQIPWTAKRNLYFFIGMDDADKVSETSLAAKYEFLIGETEMSFSALTGGEQKPVYGFDFSGTKIGSFNLHGEVSLNPGDRQMMDYDTLRVGDEADDWTPKACLGFTKYFDNGDIRDRISLTSEFYYNGAGYDQNIFQKINAEPDPVKRQTYKSDFMATPYQPYMYSKYYIALFGSVKKFLNPDITFNINAIANLVDNSSTLITGITYSPALTDFTLDFHINGYFGDPNTEATFSGNKYSIYLGTKILF